MIIIANVRRSRLSWMNSFRTNAPIRLHISFPPAGEISK
jgi:hypothetical protein